MKLLTCRCSCKHRLTSTIPLAEVLDKYLHRCQLWLSSLRLPQQTIESVRFQLLKRLHNDIGVKILTVVTYPYAPHTGETCPLDSGAGVLHDDAHLGRNADSGSR